MITEKPWGSFEVITRRLGKVKDEGDMWVKMITIKPQCRFSLQLHRFRDEQWYVVKGEGEFQLGGHTRELRVSDTAKIERYMPHRLTNTGASDLVIVEVATGTVCDESDIFRIEDDYGRI